MLEFEVQHHMELGREDKCKGTAEKQLNKCEWELQMTIGR
jgi:hypothetical protein